MNNQNLLHFRAQNTLPFNQRRVILCFGKDERTDFKINRIVSRLINWIEGRVSNSSPDKRRVFNLPKNREGIPKPFSKSEKTC